MLNDDKCDLTIFARRVKELRERNGLSQKEFGKMIGVNTAAVSNYEVARNTPKVETLVLIGKIFNCSIDWLLGLEKKDKISEKVKEGDSTFTYADILELLIQLEAIISTKKDPLGPETSLVTGGEYSCKKPFEIIELPRKDRFIVKMSEKQYQDMLNQFNWDLTHTKKIPVEGRYDDTNTKYNPEDEICDIEHDEKGYLIYINDFILQDEIKKWNELINIKNSNTKGKEIYEDWKSGTIRRLSNIGFNDDIKMGVYPTFVNGAVSDFNIAATNDEELEKGYYDVMKTRK